MWRKIPAFRNRLVFLAIPLAALVSLASPALNLGRAALAQVAKEARPSEIQLAIEQGLLTLAVTNVPLADVLRAIGEQAGFKVIVHRDPYTSVTASFTRVPLDRAIFRLVGDTSMVMIYAASQGEAGPGPLAEVHLYSTPTTRVVAPGQPAGAGETQEARTTQAMAVETGRDARFRAVRAMVEQPDYAAVDDLASIVVEDEDPVVRRMAAAGLGMVGGELAVAALAQAVADEDNTVQSRAIYALGKIGDDEAARVLGEVLTGDSDAQMRRHAARALARLGSEEARRVLVAAASDPDETIRSAAKRRLVGWK